MPSTMKFRPKMTTVFLDRKTLFMKASLCDAYPARINFSIAVQTLGKVKRPIETRWRQKIWDASIANNRDRRETCRNFRSKICLSIFSKPIIEGSLEVKLPTIWTDEKQRWEKSEKRREEERRSKKRKSQKKEDPGARKGRKVAKHWVFPLIRCGAKHVSKSKCTKHTMFGPLLEVEMSKECTALWREAHFQVKMYKADQCRTAFGSRHVEKVHGIVARSTLRSQKCKKLTGSEHFWKLRCRKKVHAVVVRSTFRSQTTKSVKN